MVGNAEAVWNSSLSYVTNVKLSVHMPVQKFTVHMSVDQETDDAA